MCVSWGGGGIKYFMSVFKRRLSDNFLQEWDTRIESSSRAKTYSPFSDFSYEPYLDILKIDIYRIAMSNSGCRHID